MNGEAVLANVTRIISICHKEVILKLVSREILPRKDAIATHLEASWMFGKMLTRFGGKIVFIAPKIAFLLSASRLGFSWSFLP